MMIGAVARKVSNRRADILALLLRQTAAVVRRIGHAEAKQAAIKRARDFRLHHVQAEMTQPADAKGSSKLHATDDELLACRLTDGFLELHGNSFDEREMAKR
jgi:hypothetical protein